MFTQLFDFSVNLLQVLLWQYNDAARIQSLLTSKQSWYIDNQTQFWTNWFNDVFNLQTANDFGLSVWAYILNLPLQITPTVDPPEKHIFGFAPDSAVTPSNGFYNFGNGAFTSSNTVFNLTTEEQRICLQLRYFKLVSRCAIPEINRSLAWVFKNLGTVYLIDLLNMNIRLVFTFTPTERLLSAIQFFDLIPRGLGVGIEYVNTTSQIFGFAPDSNVAPINGFFNFGNGAFQP